MKYKLRYAIFTFLLFTLIQSIFLNPTVHSQPFFCKDVYPIYARGSGEALVDSDGWKRFKKQLTDRLANDVSSQIYELVLRLKMATNTLQ
jgi:hypothetical protein